MSLTSFEFWLLAGLVSILIVVIGKFLSSLLDEIRGMRIEITDLNKVMTKVVNNQDWHAEKLASLDLRISRLENK